MGNKKGCVMFLFWLCLASFLYFGNIFVCVCVCVFNQRGAAEGSVLGLGRTEGTCKGDGKAADLLAGGEPGEVGCPRSKDVWGCQFPKTSQRAVKMKIETT